MLRRAQFMYWENGNNGRHQPVLWMVGCLVSVHNRCVCLGHRVLWPFRVSPIAARIAGLADLADFNGYYRPLLAQRNRHSLLARDPSPTWNRQDDVPWW